MHDNQRQRPRGRNWGEQTVQSVGGRGSAPKDWHTDADEIRRQYSIPPLDIEAFRDVHEDAIVYPDMIVHEKKATLTRSNKGTDCLVKGDRDCGKTTFGLNLSERVMETNDERVIWRGRQGGSGWLPYKHWATVYLPAEMDVTAYWMQEDEDIETGDPLAGIDDLEDVVRDVVYYDGVYDLLDTLGERPAGTFNVVYPDPAFRDCEAITAKTDRGHFAGKLPFTPEWEAGEKPPTPVTDWWAAFLVARAEHGPFQWMTWVCDEAGDLFPQEARNDDGRPLYDILSMLRGVWATSRKRLLSIVMFVHHEENLHSKIRREFKWRIHMPDGSANPVDSRRSSHPVGFKGNVPMAFDLMSNRDIGEALCYTKNSWAEFAWSDIEAFPEDTDRWLSIRVEAPDDPPETLGSGAEDAAAAELEFDGSIFGEWQNASDHRLYVKDPGSGSVSIETGRIVEELVSPVEDIHFDGMRVVGPYREVIMSDGDETIVVARIPKHEEGAGQAGGVAGD